MDKKYGYSAGMLTECGQKKIIEGSEYQVYSMIDALGYFIWRNNHDLADGRIEMTENLRKTLDDAQYAIEFAVFNTRRFGVEIPEPKDGEHVQRTDSYNKWYRWWDEYIKHILTEDQYDNLRELVENDEDHSSYRPDGDWR